MGRLQREVGSWMFDHALPLWAEAGVDRLNGGFVEELTLQGHDNGSTIKRTRVTARQIYVFSHAHMLGWPQGLELAHHGMRFLDKAWDHQRGIWVRSLTRTGEVADGSADLYDIAFAIFATGWWVKASGDPAPARRASAAFDFLRDHMRGPVSGFFHTQSEAEVRQQNPHMHLLEASLVMTDATQDPRFAALSSDLIELFKKHLFDGRSLREFFGPHWNPLDTEAGKIIEPGHMFEWAWILAQHQKLSGANHEDTIWALVETAECIGVDKNSYATVQQAKGDGTILDGSSRVWPNTERMKGWIAAEETAGRSAGDAVERSADLLLARYLQTSKRGLWIDHFDSKGNPLSKAVPASTFYHLFLAFAEFLRWRSRGATGSRGSAPAAKDSSTGFLG